MAKPDSSLSPKGKAHSRVKPIRFPFKNKGWGKVLHCAYPLPGVYEIEAEHNYGWVVDRTVKSVIPRSIDQYGEVSEDGRAVWFDYEHGRHVVEYEVLSHQLKTCAPEDAKELRAKLVEVSVFGAEDYSDFFGDWLPQHTTPWGRMTRYITVDRGIWFVQAEAQWALCLNHVVHLEFEDPNQELAKTATGNPGYYPDFTFEDRYWAVEDCAPILYMMIQDARDGQERFSNIINIITSEADLQCHLCEHNTSFVARYNAELEIKLQSRRLTDPSYDGHEEEAMKIKRRKGASPDYLKILF